MRYIAKPGTWFKAGTEVKLIVPDICGTGNSGLFRGLRICENPESEGGIPKGTERWDDEEICMYDEFEVVE